MYSRDTLLFLRESPICRTPPAAMPSIPGITAPAIETNENTKREKQVCITYKTL